MRRLVIPLHPLYCVSSMNEITRRLFQLALSGNTLRANTGFYKYLKFPPGLAWPGLPDCTISVSEDGLEPPGHHK